MQKSIIITKIVVMNYLDLHKNQHLEMNELLPTIKKRIDLFIIYLNQLVIDRSLDSDKIYLRECKNEENLSDYLKYLINIYNKIITELKLLQFNVETISKVIESRIKKIDSLKIDEIKDYTLIESLEFKLNTMFSHCEDLSYKINYTPISEFSQKIDLNKMRRENKIDNLIYHQ